MMEAEIGGTWIEERRTLTVSSGATLRSGSEITALVITKTGALPAIKTRKLEPQLRSLVTQRLLIPTIGTNSRTTGLKLTTL